jgi:hypothetical protein
MKNLFNQLFTSILTIGFVFAFNLFSAQSVDAQEPIKNPPYLAKIKDDPEVKELAKYAEKLADFYRVGDSIAKVNTSPGTAEVDSEWLERFQSSGRNIMLEDRSVGAASYRLLKKLAAASEEELKKEAEKLLKTRFSSPFLSKPLSVLAGAVAETERKRISTDTRNILDKPLKLGFYKPKFPCAVLATAILAAELRNANKTAANVDSFFKAVCNANGQ